MDGASWSALGPLAIMFDRELHRHHISDVGSNGDKSPHGVFAGTYAGPRPARRRACRPATTEGSTTQDAEVVLFGIINGGVGAARAAEDPGRVRPELKVKAWLCSKAW